MSELGENKIPEKLPFEIKRQLAGQDRLQKNWLGIENRLTLKNQKSPTRKRWASLMVAASLLVASAWLVWFSQQSKDKNAEWTVVETGIGEVRRITLPDSSTVLLNSNSTLKVPAKWNSRTVWLKGEGYFEITKSKTPEMKHFVVHTNSMDVKVLGTKFNVTAYSEKATVALKEGSVEVSYGEINQPATSKKVLIMKPGDVVYIKEEKSTRAVIGQTAPEKVADWAMNEYNFENTTLSEIGETIYNRFGYTMEWNDNSLPGRSMSGHLHADSLDELITAIEVTLNINIEKKNKRLMVSSK